jgi:hypothetical protein
MSKSKSTRDAVKILHRRFVDNDPEVQGALHEERANFALSKPSPNCAASPWVVPTEVCRPRRSSADSKMEITKDLPRAYSSEPPQLRITRSNSEFRLTDGLDNYFEFNCRMNSRIHK